MLAMNGIHIILTGIAETIENKHIPLESSVVTVLVP